MADRDPTAGDRARLADREISMDLGLAGKAALVTGGSAGIGKGIARALAREGADVAICARRRDVLEAAAAEIRAETGRKVVVIPADLTRTEDAERFVTGAAAEL
ncbi:MAG: SDR family NAD(P)-dependent oxidoreductase, partial [Candidatus Rokuibacteriota bacterium]